MIAIAPTASQSHSPIASCSPSRSATQTPARIIAISIYPSSRNFDILGIRADRVISTTYGKNGYRAILQIGDNSDEIWGDACARRTDRPREERGRRAAPGADRRELGDVRVVQRLRQ
jgi:hypothetical protein